VITGDDDRAEEVSPTSIRSALAATGEV